MKLNNYLSLFFISIIFIVYFYGCSNDSTVTPTTETGTGTTQTVTSSQQGNITYDGFKLVFPVGTVPSQTNGSDGTVIFSMNTTSSMPTGLTALPSGYTQVGKILQAGPENFVFNTTVRVYLPCTESSPTNLYVMGYFPEENGWKLIPAHSGTDSASGTHYMMIDVLKLGYFTIVRGSTPDHMFSPEGGVQWCTFDGQTFIILTVASVTFAEPGIAAFISGGMVGKTFISPNIPGMPFPSDYCRGIVPLGTYTFWVSTRSWMSNDIQTYSIPVPVTVTNSLNWPLGWIYTVADGWTLFGCQLPAGGTWVPGRPQNWPTPTIPYGSGTVQATLTWNNSNGNEADMDLHLYGPNSLHVYYASPTSPNFALDRDWQSQDGDATENIYSTTTTIPSGNYRINVNHFSGASKSFNCRVVVNGNVTNYSGNLSAGSVDVRTFTIQ